MSKQYREDESAYTEYDPYEQDPQTGRKDKDRGVNKEMAVVTYIFIFLFLILSGYILYFVIHDSDSILNNPANKRSEVWAKHVTRGSILSSDGKKLAYTETDDEGNETRRYPYGGMYAHVVGRYSHGATGLESSENYELLNTNLNPIDKMLNEFNGKKSPGNNVVTTLDMTLTDIAYSSLGDRRGAVIAMDPHTGKILTMVSKPTYDPGSLTDEKWKKLSENSDEDSPFYSRATQGLYPPGSTFKVYTALAYIRQNPDFNSFSYKCTGSIGTGDGSIRCYGGKVHGKVNLKQAFAKSCNTAFCNIGTKLDRSRWQALCESFYFNKSTPIDKLASSTSRFKITKDTSAGDVMQDAIGQGDVLVSPLQNIFSVAAVANNGILMKPYVVDHIESFDGKRLSETTQQKIAEPLSAEEVKQMKKLLRETVKTGTATELYYGTPYKAAGKTGSAEFKTGSSESHAWFIGYAKYKGKSLAISVLVERGGTGSGAAVPIARKIFNAWAEKQ